VVLDKYQYEAEGLVKGECGLKILANMAADEDIGDWTCVARLQGKNQEGQDFITLKRTEVNGMLTTHQPINRSSYQPTYPSTSFTPRPLYHRERTPGTHWRGGWVGPRAGPDAVVKREIPNMFIIVPSS